MSAPGSIAQPHGLPAVGTLVGGKYLLERYLAEGGMGVIAVARHVELDEPVALKFLKPEIVAQDSSGTLASRFVREARATIKIRSEHVPRIFDVSTSDGVPFIVMELLTGDDLDVALTRRGPLPVVFVVDAVLQALEALGAAHALGMVHRDIKPANLFVATRLDGSTSVKVLDFGIAKLVETGAAADPSLTGTNASMGSPQYMSPEQMRSARDVDGRADIWAVGTTIYELLTGEAPFRGDSITQVCAAILQDQPAPMKARRPDVPAALDAVVSRCLAKRPAERFDDVAVLAAALAPFGTPPIASELALRVARVLGTKPTAPHSEHSSSPSHPSLEPAAVVAHVGASTIGPTSISWGTLDAGAQASRRRKLAIASVLVGSLFVVGVVLVGVSLLRTRPPPMTALAGSAALVAAPPPPVSSMASSIPLATTAAETPRLEAAATAAPKSLPKPIAEPRPPMPPITKPTVAKPTAPPAGGLWDDRK